jgi:hypothetical protein
LLSIVTPGLPETGGSPHHAQSRGAGRDHYTDRRPVER